MTDMDKQVAGALGKVPSGLFILTAGQGSEATGMLASWVQQCAFEPPSICLAIKPDRPFLGRLSAGVRFVVNILDQTQTDMVAHFGRGFPPGEPAFAGLETTKSSGDDPVLVDALAYLDCRLIARYPAGDHDLFVAEVVGGKVQGSTQPMVHVRKSGSHY